LVDQDANAALKKVAVLLKTELATAVPMRSASPLSTACRPRHTSILELETKARDAVFRE